MAPPPAPPPEVQAGAPPPPPRTPGAGSSPFSDLPAPVQRTGVAVALLLVVGLLTIAFQPAETGDSTPQPVAADTTSSTAPPPPETAATQAPARAPATTAPAASPPPTAPPKPASPGPAPQAATSGDAVVDANPRSVVLSGTISELSSVHLGGLETYELSGQVFDSSGADLGYGRVRVTNGDARLSGTGLELGFTFLKLTGSGPGTIDSDLMHDSRPSSGNDIEVSGEVTLESAGIMFDPDGEEGERPLASPVRVNPGLIGVTYAGDNVTWHDPPAGAMKARGGWLNWAGPGRVEHSGTTYGHEYLGLRGDTDVTIDRSGGGLRVTGTVEADSVWEDGFARTATQAGVTLKEAPAPITAGSSGWFTWAPVNSGSFDMAMTRIAPANDAGGWVELRLDLLPDMDGGEGRPRRGADTSGLITYSSTKGISSMIRPGKGDERGVKIHVPEGTPPGSYTVSLVVEGNFDPIRVDVPVTVESPAA